MTKLIPMLLLLGLVFFVPHEIDADHIQQAPIDYSIVRQIGQVRKKPLTMADIEVILKIQGMFPEAPVMVHVANSESGLNPLAKNPSSTATGLFQILKSTWQDAGCTGNPKNANDNLVCARKLFDKSGTKPWNESRDTWKKFL